MIMTDLSEAQILTIVKNTVEQHGCVLVDIDLGNKILNLEGPERLRSNAPWNLPKFLIHPALHEYIPLRKVCLW